MICPIKGSSPDIEDLVENRGDFTYITNLVRAARTHLYGRRMYETMMVWETDPNLAAESPLMRDFAEIWQAANKRPTKSCTPGR